MLISSSLSKRAFIDSLNRYSRNTTINTPDPDWVSFLRDHREWLIGNDYCRLETLTETEMNQYRYRIKDYLRSKDASSELELAFKVINRIGSDLDFDISLETVWIPHRDHINSLYYMYLTIKDA